MILVLGFEQSETASLEAASGKHKKVMSEAENETILNAPETEYHEQITDIALFLLRLNERILYRILYAQTV